MTSFLLTCGTRWPQSARLAIALLREGCVVSANCPPDHPLRYVRGLRKTYLYWGFAARRSLTRAIRDSQPDLIVPCDDSSVAQLHELHERYPEFRQLIEYSLGEPHGYTVAGSRDALLDCAQQLGIRVPPGCLVLSEEHARSCYRQHGAPAVLKLDGTSGGEGVQIVRSEAEATAAFRRLSKAASTGTAWKQLYRDALALWARSRRDRPRINIQTYMDGTPANIMVACWRGEIVGEISVRALSCQGPTGAASVVQQIENQEFSRAAALLARQLGISGFFGLDFILEHGSGAAYLIEMNPRCTQLGHLPLRQASLAAVLRHKVSGKINPNSGAPIVPDTIALFPQAWQRGANSDYLRSVYHDVPWEEPRLVSYLIASPWLARISRFFRPKAARRAI